MKLSLYVQAEQSFVRLVAAFAYKANLSMASV